MVARATVIFAIAVAAIRLGDKRFLGRNTAFDLMMAVLFGSTASRAINGSAPFFPTIVTCCALVILHAGMSAAAFHSHRVGKLIKGQRSKLVNDGEIDWGEMRSSHITRRDLEAQLRLRSGSAEISDIETAYLERNGEISIILRSEPQGEQDPD